jgi:hypothetical protein
MSPKSASGEVRRGAQILGTIALVEGEPQRILYRFVPGPDFESYRPLFEMAMELARQITNSIDQGEGMNYRAHSQWVAAIERIAKLQLLVGNPPQPIREFALFEDWLVEIEFGTPFTDLWSDLTGTA